MEEEVNTEELECIDEDKKRHFSYMFSNWMLIWFVLYYILIHIQFDIQYTYIQEYIQENCNPCFCIYFALIANLCAFCCLIYFLPSINVAFQTLVMIFSLKITPIYLLKHITCNYNKSFSAFLMVFSIYNFYLWVNNTNFYEVYKISLEKVIYKKKYVPHLTRVYNKITKLLQHYRLNQIHPILSM